MWIAGLQVGLTTADLKAIQFTELLCLLDEWGDMNAPDDDVRDADESDVALLML